jgi:hypothetical protein
MDCLKYNWLLVVPLRKIETYELFLKKSYTNSSLTNRKVITQQSESGIQDKLHSRFQHKIPFILHCILLPYLQR